MRSEYRYGFFTCGYGKARWRRMTLLERIRLWWRRRKRDDLSCLKGSWGV